jgi:hypothetical protein
MVGCDDGDLLSEVAQQVELHKNWVWMNGKFLKHFLK